MKLWKNFLPLLVVALTGAATSTGFAQSSFTALYDFSGVLGNSGGSTDPTPPPTASGVTFSSFSSVGAASNPNAGGRFSFTSQPTGGVNGSDDFSQFTGSLSTTAYFEVTLTPLNQIELQLDTISFIVQRSSTGIRNYAVRSSVDGFAANLPASISPGNANLAVGPGNEFQWALDSVTTAQTGSLVTPGLSHVGLTAPVTFRFYGWNAEGGAGTFSVDNVSFSGSTRMIPEPAASAILALSLGAWAIIRRRKLPA